MNWKLFAVCGLVLPATCVAQPVFFDDFDGDSLLPQWSQPRAEDWEYNVSNGMLNVTNLFYPSDPMSSGNYAIMGAAFAQQRDFQIDIWMGWDVVNRPQRLNMAVVGATGGILADFGYRNEPAFGPNPVILCASGARAISVPAPLFGLHHFTLARSNQQFSFFLDGSQLGSVPVAYDFLTIGISFEFVGPYPAPMSPLRIDRVIVVPSPGTVVGIVSVAIGYAWRRRR